MSGIVHKQPTDGLRLYAASPAELDNYPWLTAPQEGRFHVVEYGRTFQRNHMFPGVTGVGLNHEAKFADKRVENARLQKRSELQVFPDGRCRLIAEDGKVIEYRTTLKPARPPLNAPKPPEQKLGRER